MSETDFMEVETVETVDQRTPDLPSRTGERVKDELAFYTNSVYYDCTFKISYIDNDGANLSKVFKCHKYTLARASEVLAKMLYGSFSESSRDKDEPIVLNDVRPDTFDVVMKFIYGELTNFKNTTVACDVYKFAHKWQIIGLLDATANFLKTPKPTGVLIAHEMFRALGINSHNFFYRNIIATNTNIVLKSPAWLNAPVSTVEEILKMDPLNIKSERDLLEALFKWANGDEDLINLKAIRAKTKNALKLIRFMTFDSVQFAKLCTSSCAQILTDKEKLEVFLSINLADKKLLPENFSNCRHFRNLDVNLNIGRYCIPIVNGSLIDVTCSKSESVLKFVSGNSKFYLTGVQLYSLHENADGAQIPEIDLICKVTEASLKKAVVSVAYKGACNFPKQKYLKLPREVRIKKNVIYTLTVEYFQTNAVPSKSYTLNNNSVLAKQAKINLSFPFAANLVTDFQALCFTKVA